MRPLLQGDIHVEWSANMPFEELSARGGDSWRSPSQGLATILSPSILQI